MKINGNFDQPVVVHSPSVDWLSSPMPGVFRRPLDRVGEEKARATSIVKYAPGSKFSAHQHTGGEEFLVLEGVFQDEHGDFPAGTYVRNPPTSIHTPGSMSGCVIFVKLWQFDMADRAHVNIRSDLVSPIPHRSMPGVDVIPLYEDKMEAVSIQHWSPGAHAELDLPGGAEVLVLAGQWDCGEYQLKTFSWIRLPANTKLKGKAGGEGAKIWIKTGHLLHVERDLRNLKTIL